MRSYVRTLLWPCVAAALLCVAGCGGEESVLGVETTFIQITASSGLNPTFATGVNGGRVIFINKDFQAHSVAWTGGFFNGAQNVGAGGQIAFTLPSGAAHGTTYGYKLDQNGPTGTVTIL